MSTYRTEGIVLRRSNFGEANLLLQLYTKDFGIRIEDDVLVTDDGYEVLTKSDRSLIIL